MDGNAVYLLFTSDSSCDRNGRDRDFRFDGECFNAATTIRKKTDIKIEFREAGGNYKKSCAKNGTEKFIINQKTSKAIIENDNKV